VARPTGAICPEKIECAKQQSRGRQAYPTDFGGILTERQYPKQPLVGVGALIVASGRVVLIQRGHAPQLGEWSIPGGMLELGETVRQGAEREAWEETSLRVRATELLGVFDRVVLDDQKRILYHYVLIDFLCAVVSGELQASGDAADARWFTGEEVDTLPLARDTSAVVRRALSESGS
jgi:ADP-ribose pyrophosphatase YjhB (NUDIX family)